MAIPKQARANLPCLIGQRNEPTTLPVSRSPSKVSTKPDGTDLEDPLVEERLICRCSNDRLQVNRDSAQGTAGHRPNQRNRLSRQVPCAYGPQPTSVHDKLACRDGTSDKISDTPRVQSGKPSLRSGRQLQ
jgi:hypothetical protein